MSTWESQELPVGYVVIRMSATGENLSSSDAGTGGPNLRQHHLLRHKLTLDENTGSNKAASGNEAGKADKKWRITPKELSSKETSHVER